MRMLVLAGSILSVVACAPPDLTVGSDATDDGAAATDGTGLDVMNDTTPDIARESSVDVRADTPSTVDVPADADCGSSMACGCVDLQTDPSHCGSCATVCPAAPNATPSCANGMCGIACNTGFANCNGNASDGCEVNVATDLSNCGTCGNVCPAAPANSTEACVSGMCVFRCDAGFGNCDGNAANGCETVTSTDTNNCGTCGTVCPTGFVCRLGHCALCTIRCGTVTCPCGACCGTTCC